MKRSTAEVSNENSVKAKKANCSEGGTTLSPGLVSPSSSTVSVAGTPSTASPEPSPKTPDAPYYRADGAVDSHGCGICTNPAGFGVIYPDDDVDAGHKDEPEPEPAKSEKDAYNVGKCSDWFASRSTYDWCEKHNFMDRDGDWGWKTWGWTSREKWVDPSDDCLWKTKSEWTQTREWSYGGTPNRYGTGAGAQPGTPDVPPPLTPAHYSPRTPTELGR